MTTTLNGTNPNAAAANGAATVDAATAVQEDARHAYRHSVAAGAPLTGRQLGEMFDRGERWGRARITEVRTTMPPRPTCTRPMAARRTPTSRPSTTPPRSSRHR